MEQAYAWARLASQNDNEDLVAFRDAILEAIPEAERDGAREQAAEYMEKFGNQALAMKAHRQVRRSLRSCTGSRLGSSCEQVYIASMPNYVGMAPGNGNDDATNSAATATAGSSGEIGNSGGPSRDIEYYFGLRKTLKQLNQYIEENTGNVELRELELVDEPGEADAGEQDQG